MMYRIAIRLLLLVAMLALVSPAAEAATWETTLERGSAAAVKAGKPMLIEFWADWCPPCRVMDAEVYPDPAVSKAMSKVQWVRVDVDEQERVSRQYNVTGMPTIVFADSYGTELFRFTGTLTVETLVQLLKELPSDVREINRLSQTIAGDKNNFGALENLGRVLRAAAQVPGGGHRPGASGLVLRTEILSQERHLICGTAHLPPVLARPRHRSGHRIARTPGEVFR